MSETIDEGNVGEDRCSVFGGVLGEGSRVVTARGTEDGLVLRIDGRSSWEEIVSELRTFLGTRRRFLEGGEVSVEWLDRLPTREQSAELEQFLKAEYGIEVVPKKKRPVCTMITLDGKSKKDRKGAKMVSLFDSPEEKGAAGAGSSEAERAGLHVAVEGTGQTAASGPHHGGSSSPLEDFLDPALDREKSFSKRVAKILGEDLPYEEDANAKVVFATFRSGQRVETPFSLIVIGDVNPGADLVAGGDIIVFGSLRGTAHAGAYDDEAQDRVIIAQQMQPMQLRIGSVISRGNDEVGKGPEIARIDNRRIMVEAYNPRAVPNRKARI